MTKPTKILTTLALTAAILIPQPAAAHTELEVDTWLYQWLEAIAGHGGITIELVIDYLDFAHRHPCAFGNCVELPVQYSPPAPSVESWRPLIATHFDAGNVDAALAVLSCESRGNPNATNTSSGAAGLFQHLPRYWPDRSAAAGIPGADIYDPTANVIVASWLSNRGANWTHWVCKP